jgi:hypothetical protein
MLFVPVSPARCGAPALLGTTRNATKIQVRQPLPGVSQLAVGPLADTLGARPVALGTGVLYAAAAAAPLASRAVRELPTNRLLPTALTHSSPRN